MHPYCRHISVADRLKRVTQPTLSDVSSLSVQFSSEFPGGGGGGGGGGGYEVLSPQTVFNGGKSLLIRKLEIA